ncbi:MAG TPA: hypothetical protein VN903_27350 [Polyangia bacterium]|jgi:predicted DCC family thiol-disulfide oxidoreductase YuxK|nr:hypothetical protein [Polyangia bacterium]
MRVVEKARDAVWRLLEWSFVMGVLSWLLVRMWNESIYDRNRRPRQSWLGRLRSSRLICTGRGAATTDASDRQETTRRA